MNMTMMSIFLFLFLLLFSDFSPLLYLASVH